MSDAKPTRAEQDLRWAWWLAGWSVLGVTVPILLLSVGWVVNRDIDLYSRIGYELHQITTFLWPTSFMLLATAGIEHTGRGYAFVGIAIATNMFLYGVFGGLLLWLRRLASGMRQREA